MANYVQIYWPYISNKLTRRVIISICVFLTLLCICGTYWASLPSRGLDIFDPKHQSRTSFSKIETLMSRYNHGARVSVEEELLRAVDKLSMKAMSPSPVLLEDLYFMPSKYNFEVYNNRVLHQPVSCGSPTLLTILVPTHPRAARERAAVRETWGSVARGKPWPPLTRTYNVKLYFVLGTSAGNGTQFENDTATDLKMAGEPTSGSFEKKSRPTTYGGNETDASWEGSEMLVDKTQINDQYNHGETVQEMMSFDDIIQFDVIDSYRNLTRKLILAFDWLTRSCRETKFVLKADPDVFVNVPLLVTLLKHYGQPNSIYGQIYPNSWVVREGKWAVDNRTLPIDKYPIYTAGNAYVMSKDAVEKVLSLAPHFPYISVEDAFITGILASVGGVERINVAGFTRWSESFPDACQFANNKKYVGNNATDHRLRVTWWGLRVPETNSCHG